MTAMPPLASPLTSSTLPPPARRARALAMASMLLTGGGVALLQLGLAPVAEAAAPASGMEFYAFGLANHPSAGPDVIRPAYANPGAVQAIVTATHCKGLGAGASIVPALSSVEPNLIIPMAVGTTAPTRDPVYRFVADRPVGVSIINSYRESDATSDVSQLLPVSQWGTSYVVTTYTVAGMAGPSEIAIVAAAPATVTVTPSSATLGGGGTPPIPASTSYTFSLGACEGIQFQSNGDLTGTTVTTTGTPVGVFAGDRCAQIPAGVEACDHLEEQVWPVDAWDTEYVLCRSPVRYTESDLVRVLALTPGTTTVSVSGSLATTFTLTTTATTYGWHEFAASGDVFISADHPVSVVQFLTGGMASGSKADPAMAQVQPVATLTGAYALHTWSSWPESFVTLGVKAGSSTLLDGAPPGVGFTPVGSSGFLCGWTPVGPGFHDVSSTDKAVVQHGAYGRYTSYLAPAFATASAPGLCPQGWRASPLIDDDFSSDPNTNSLWNVHRFAGVPSEEAAWVPGELALTAATRARASAIVADAPLAGNQAWQATFDYRITVDPSDPYGGSDGLVFMFMKDDRGYQVAPPTPSGLPLPLPPISLLSLPSDAGEVAPGPALGFTSLTSPVMPGFGIEFDGAEDPALDPSGLGSHIALIQDSAELPNAHLAAVSAPAGVGGMPVTKDGAWHRAVVEHDPATGTLTVRLGPGGGPVGPTPVLTYTGMLLPQGTKVGFSAATGAGAAEHVVAGLLLCVKAAPQPPLPPPTLNPTPPPEWCGISTSWTESFAAPPAAPWLEVRGTNDVANEGRWMAGPTLDGSPPWPATGFYDLTSPGSTLLKNALLLRPGTPGTFASDGMWGALRVLDFSLRAGGGSGGGSLKVLFEVSTHPIIIEFRDSTSTGPAVVTINGNPATAGPGVSLAGDGQAHRVWIVYTSSTLPNTGSAIAHVQVYEDSLSNLVASAGLSGTPFRCELPNANHAWGFHAINDLGTNEHAIDDITLRQWG